MQETLSIYADFLGVFILTRRFISTIIKDVTYHNIMRKNRKFIGG